MKRNLLMMPLLMMASVMLAVPAKRGQFKSIVLEDGRQVRVQLVGDEHGHYYQSAEGKAYVMDNGRYVEADKAQIMAKAARRKAGVSKARKARLERNKVGGAGKVFEGEKKGLIILVEFKDVKFAEGHDRSLYNSIANEEGYTSGEGFTGSVSDYFKAQSGGMFRLNFDVVGPIQLENDMAYYGGDMKGYEEGTDERPQTMVVEACQAVADMVDFADYDWDGDGEVDQVFVLYAGLGQANGGDSDTVWPHEWQLSDTSGDYGRKLSIDGVNIDTYACSNELAPVYDENYENITGYGLDGIGTICHEFSHCLGFPDMYDTNYVADGMYTWDLMDQGSYNGDGFVPSGYTSYEKMVAGWITPVELDEESTEVTGLAALSEGGGAYIIYNKANPEEFYMLENRQLTGWDQSQYGQGLLVLHVDYDERAWNNNIVNNDATHQRCTIIPADGATTYTSKYMGYEYFDEDKVAGDPYPNGGKTQLSDTSSPKASLFNANTDGKKLMHISITNITQNADGTISFSYAPTGVRAGEDPTPGPNPDGALFYESFNDCDGTGGNDGLWSGNVASATFTPDNEGWESEKAYGADQCARFGTSKLAGLATTPSFTIDGEVTFSFKAGAWDAKNDGTTMTLSVNGDATISPNYVELEKGDWGEYTTTIKGTGTISINFLADKRFFLDEVIAVGSTSGIKDAGMAMGNDAEKTAVCNLQGIRVGESLDRLPRGIYVIGGRKVVK
ncbi:MAG: M6 family metalloprotease domain-containing protein [Prevotella sp.]|nr:M6 family metalloprotease domain-containing protein [Prevotella sp.]